MSAVPTRRAFVLLTCLTAMFVMYGSLVPFNRSDVSLEETRVAIGAFLRMDTVRFSSTDFVTNLALLVPFGFCLTGALALDRTVTSAAVILALALGTGLAFAAELSQVFFPDRTPSMADVLAQTIGNLSGIVGWCLFGPGVTSWLRALHDERDGARRTTRVLGLLAAGIVVAELLPLDFTVRPAELAAKYRAGRVLLQPHWPHDVGLAAFGGWLPNVLLCAPFGMLALVGWTRRDRRRDLLTAVALGWLAVAGLELAQLFVWSRVTDAMDVLTGGTGVTAGALVAARICKRIRPGDDATPASWATLARLGIGGWIGCLAVYHWTPFDFRADASFVRQRLSELLFVPLASYAPMPTLDLLREILAKLALTLALGALLRFASPGNPARPSRLWTAFALAFGGLVLTGLELGQLLLPTRYPDVGDVLVGEMGVILGFHVAGLLIGGSNTVTPLVPHARDRVTPNWTTESDCEVPWPHFRPRERRL
ncbi:MAG: VanZ family protein [Acidobacteria bacterium]|nr:VanZ family protein [Acidobacteriota bacterium]